MRSRHLPFLFSAVLAVVTVARTASAQTNTWNGNKINGVPASVTSFGFGGRPGFHGVPASVTSLNFGQVPNAGAFHHPHAFGDGRHHRTQGLVNPFYGSTYYVPYAYPVYVMPTYDGSAYGSSIEDMQPAVSERAGPDAAEEVRRELESLRSTVRDYRDELRAKHVTEQPAPQAEPAQPAASQPQTVLVFKDGRQAAVGNYAIVGGTLYDLSEGRTKKVALAELDLAATVKQNDERGVEFRLPATSN
jgi:hypothetical protein